MRILNQNYTKLIKDSILFGGLIISFVLVSFAGSTLADSKNSENMPPIFTGEFKKIPLKKAAVSIGEKIGYNVVIQSLDPSLPVSGKFIEKDVYAVFTSLLKGYNLVILIDDDRRIVNVKSLGGKNKTGNSDSVSLNQSQNVIADRYQENDDGENSKEHREGSFNDENAAVNDGRDPFTRKTEKEIIKLHSEQKNLIENEMRNPNIIEPFTGMTNAEIIDLHKKQNEKISGDNP